MSNRSKRKSGQRNYSGIKDHKFEKGKLTPPFAQLPKDRMRTVSWADDRLPEMLWAALVVSLAPRHIALDIFRRVANVGFEVREQEPDIEITLSGLARLGDETFFRIISEITYHPMGTICLKPLLLLDCLPSKARWKYALATTSNHSDWELLSQSIAKNLDHQSQEATDCRWVTVLFSILNRGMQLPNDMRMEIFKYPDEGDMRSVRPSIRALEMTMRMMPNDVEAQQSRDFCTKFWSECLAKTECILSEHDSVRPASTSTPAEIMHIWPKLIKHFFETNTSTAVDPKHDGAFGFAFYGLALLLDASESAGAITGRLTLRALAECLITFAYLIHESRDDLWQSYRVYGAGQAKLAFLKLMEATGDLPSFATEEELERICNEDVFQEFLEINTAHWDKSNLRAMADRAGCKDIYDNYYGWTSAYMHGHWGAMRDTVFSTCFNPLHRLHRIPRSAPRELGTVMPSMVSLQNKILDLLDQLYPSLNLRLYEIPGA